jgi:hypothetical protein
MFLKHFQCFPAVVREQQRVRLHRQQLLHEFPVHRRVVHDQHLIFAVRLAHACLPFFWVPDLLILNLAEPGGPAGSAPFSAAKVTPAGSLFAHYNIYPWGRKTSPFKAGI